jgi:hypothetical protein
MEFIKDNQKELIIGVVCGLIVAIILGVLSTMENLPPVKVPFWLFVSVITIPVVTIIFISIPKKIKDVSNESFGVERIYIDGKHLTNCKLDSSELVFKGKTVASMSNCTGSNTRMAFEGYAGNTINFLIALRSDSGTKHFADACIAQIIKKSDEIAHSKSQP